MNILVTIPTASLCGDESCLLVSLISTEVSYNVNVV